MIFWQNVEGRRVQWRTRQHYCLVELLVTWSNPLRDSMRADAIMVKMQGCQWKPVEKADYAVHKLYIWE